MVLPPVIWLNVWIANGAVPSDAGSRSAYTRSVAPGVTAADVSTRCAQTICSVDVMRRACSGSGHTMRGVAATAALNSRRPTAKMPPVCRISSSFALSGTGSYVLPCVSFVSRRDCGSKLNASPSRASATASGLCTTCRPRLSALRRKMSPMLWPQTMTISRPTSSAMAFRPAGLISRDDPIANRSPAIDERLAAMDARAEIGHQVAERAGLPALVERVEALGHAIGGGRNLIGVDGVELLRLARGPSDPRKSARGRGSRRSTSLSRPSRRPTPPRRASRRASAWPAQSCA